MNVILKTSNHKVKLKNFHIILFLCNTFYVYNLSLLNTVQALGSFDIFIGLCDTIEASKLRFVISIFLTVAKLNFFYS